MVRIFFDMTVYWIALLGAVTISTVGQTLLKTGAAADSFLAQLFSPPTMLGLVLYGGSALLYIVALRRIPMSVALPCTALSYVVVALIGHHLFGEAFGILKVGAIFLICAGVALLAFA